MMVHCTQAASVFEDTAHGKWYRNVRDYGAKGDGVTDDTSAFKTALTQGRADVRSTQQQLVLYVPSGTYIISDALSLYFYTTLMGNATHRPILKMAANTAPSSRVYAIAGPASCDGCEHTDDFYYQVKNVVVDISAPGNTQAVGIHWALSQATILRRVSIIVGDADMGIFGENGSGGVMSDVEVSGGRVGMSFGNQQWTFVNVHVSNARDVGVQIIWNWEFVFLGCSVSSTPVAFQFPSVAGSLLIKNSVFTDIGAAVIWTDYLQADNRTILLQNVSVSNSASAALLSCYKTTDCDRTPTPVPQSGLLSNYIVGWKAGYAAPTYVSGEVPQQVQAQEVHIAAHPVSPPEAFFNAVDAGAKGDCVQSDSAAIQSAVDNHDVVFLPSGCYLLTETLVLGANTQLFGAGLTELRNGMQGSSDNATKVVISTPNSVTAATTMWDLIITSENDCTTCVLLSWGVGRGALFDVHYRMYQVVGQLLHVTQTGGGYIENMWGWVADHNIDTSATVTVRSKRGALIEASQSSALTLVGTAFEHSDEYQYYVRNASNVALVLPQTESPYWQVPPVSKALHIEGSSQVSLFAGGFYNWFNGVEAQVVSVDLSTGIELFLPNVNTPDGSNRTKGVDTVVAYNGRRVINSTAPYNMTSYCSHVAVFEG
eukprot:TRINITY_DN3142_c0_g1_i1.p1 TRINITY_DN3142_c0_g1~~TRINITY_DN3142_c0_g1_i1.p1  ORF type:complete len:686 (+),score=302.58 TRINITY_DN3142_c0_g1_i1:96-2060(+)